MPQLRNLYYVLDAIVWQLVDQGHHHHVSEYHYLELPGKDNPSRSIFGATFRTTRNRGCENVPSFVGL